MVQDFYFSFGLPEILIGLAVLGVVLFVGLAGEVALDRVVGLIVSAGSLF